MATDCVSETLMQPTCLLNPGRHIFNFECTLPTRLAPSYTSGFGAVRYRAVASMLRPTGQNYEVESPVIIRPHDHMDLNDVPSAAESETSGEKYFRRCCCRGGAVLVTASVSHAGCAIGMSLALSVQVDNNSRREAKAAVHLIKTEAFTTGSHSKECCTTVHTVSRPGLVGPHSEVADVVVIPFNATLKPSNHLDACQLMTLSYLLEVKVGISGADKPLLIQLPVVVGTHPLKVASATPAEQRALKHMRAKMSALSLNGKPRVAAPASSSSSTTTTFTPITSASSPEFRVLLTSAPPLARSTHSSTPPRSDHSSHSNTPPIVSHRPRAPTWN
ncbi:PREDICTED: arrestin domain-containing protein 2-like isoform X2 [Priapulus caudatus]|uniref:Arrestin domain-containing protein 2-like isoform X2 n=1 Tax=Priapulus caudatus TaxID=37621 RepID=A0ABM1F8W2_PRICU|nr:PREDICTED: arrestin domain-containing protein 2-like isoform X2 [Priapulus caudatus]